MDRFLSTFLYKEFKIGKATFTTMDALTVLIVSLLAIVARLSLFPIKSLDFDSFLSDWLGYIHKYGVWRSLRLSISDYTSPYMYLMCIASRFENDFYALKAVSVIFDFIGAIAIGLLVSQLTDDSRKALLGYLITILCPTVIINSAWWCQCDMIYSSFIIFALVSLFKDKGALCCFFLGLAFSFKLQTVFIFPLILILLVKGRTIKIWHLFLIPLSYLVMHIPALIAGRPIVQVMKIYLNQSQSYGDWTLNFPNLYMLLDGTFNHRYTTEVSNLGLYFSLGTIGTAVWWLCQKKFRINGEIMITMALFTICLALFTLPHMHERYGYLVDLLSIVYILQRPKVAPAGISLILLSFLSYMPFLLQVDIFPMAVLSVVYLAILIYLWYDLHSQIIMAPENWTRD